MQASGIIHWFDREDNKKESFHYWHVAARKKVMNRWRKSANEGDYFQIMPRIYDYTISNDSEDELQESTKRPPAVYTNIPVYNYFKEK